MIADISPTYSTRRRRALDITIDIDDRIRYCELTNGCGVICHQLQNPAQAGFFAFRSILNRTLRKSTMSKYWLQAGGSSFATCPLD